jgi:hypothetical protein
MKRGVQGWAGMDVLVAKFHGGFNQVTHAETADAVNIVR